jgi:hypothetical protein
MRSLHLVLMVMVVAGSSILAAQTGRQSLRPSSKWDARLETLKPSEPLDYFELAEEIADVAGENADRELARHLFALSGALDPDRLGRSACLALIDLESDELAKTRLSALASLLGDGQFMQRQSFGAADSDQLGGPAALAASEALSHYRRGEGSQALKALEKTGAQQILERYDQLLPGGLARFVEDCKHYKGQLKPTLSPGDITRMLYLEAALLSADRTWSAELLLTGGKPMIEVDPTSLDQTFGVDVSKPYFRHGRWVERG